MSNSWLSATLGVVVLPVLLVGCADSPGNCPKSKPIFFQNQCQSESGVQMAFGCTTGTVQVFRQRARAGRGYVTVRWDACCQNDKNESHCIEFARGEGAVGEHWVCPPSADWHKAPCGSWASAGAR